MDDHYAVCLGDFGAMPGDQATDGSRGGNLTGREERIEPFGTQVVEVDLVAGLSEGGAGRRRERVVEAVGIRVCQDEGDGHGSAFSRSDLDSAGLS